ncbi:TIGR02281 family clan AA aspartic protease [Aliikangiella sp. G2MR2-5]|uniref:retropepsin-like aspartic protease family protein n=1 Tax=Aliikangiella sp. G2MR2-5 TaxID=2788943 RepID=UPI001AEE5DFF|nr:TIGR02281 family clan AA aspartic protease [Aliikangiella sp. G2MR2-5]
MQTDNSQSPNQSGPDAESGIESQIGKNMIFVAWIIAIGLLTWIFGGWEEKQYNPNQTPDSLRMGEVIEVKLQKNRGGHYVVSGNINRTPVTFLVDTGATSVAVPGSLASDIGLRRGAQQKFYTANGVSTGYLTTIDELTIGEITLYNVKASIAPNMAGNEVLLGMSALGQLEYTQKAGVLTLRQAY